MSVLYPNVSHLTATYHEAIGEESSRLFEPKEINIEVLHAKSEHLGTIIAMRKLAYVANNAVRPESGHASEVRTLNVQTLDQLNTHLQVTS